MPDPAANPSAPAGPGQFEAPFLKFHFTLTITGVTEAQFVECSGLGITIERTSYIEAGNPTERQLPGLARHEPVTLRYGFTKSTELWDWVMSAVNPPVKPQDVQLGILGPDGKTEMVRFTLRNAWPCKWHAEPMVALESGAMIHELELAYETLDRQ